MRSAQRRLKDATGRLSGIYAHDGFLGHEALLQFVLSDENKRKIDDLANEKLRTFRDTYRDFSERSERLLRRGDSTRLTQLYQSWMQQCLSYFGYSGFRPSQVEHRDEGHLACLLPTLTGNGETHSVAVFFACAPNTPLRAFDSGALTDPKGQTHHKSTRQEPITEQVERALQDCGLPEAVLFMPHAAYYFRSESRTAGQCLEARWDEIMAADNDEALALATFLLRATFFAYDAHVDEVGSDGESVGEEHQDDADEGEEDDEGDTASGTGSVRLTQSSQLFKEDLEQARRITEELHKQVVLALEILINERLAVDSPLAQKARSTKHNEAIAHELFKDGLFVLYRLLFVLYAEARNFLPVHEAQFASFYSIEHLRNWSEQFLRKNRRGQANAEGTYLWGAMRAIFTLLRRGTMLRGDVQVSPYNGQLFADDRAPLFDRGPALRDEAMARVLTALTRVGGEASGRRLHFANLGVEQLGAVYEALLAQKPVVIREPSLWVPAHGGGVGLVSETLADALDMRRFEEQSSGGRDGRRATKGKAKQKSGSLSTYIDPRRPGYTPSLGKFIVAPLGGAKRQTASFYTPPKLAEFLVRRTLKPLVEGKSVEEIKKLKIIEPAMGSGGFVIAAVRYLADQLLAAKRRERKTLAERTDKKDDFYSMQRCKREVIESSIFGVDINPLAIELARTSLYLEALVPGEPLPFLHHRLKAGNSLIGADFQGKACTDWGDGQEFSLIFDLPIANIKIKEDVWKAWDNTEHGQNDSETLKEAFTEVQRSRRGEKKKIADASWSDWAIKSQTKVEVFLRQARAALAEFEKLQASGDIVDALEARHKDHLGYIPDMDPVLIEAYGVEVDQALTVKRRKALITEFGEKNYGRMVTRQRAYHRLRALGDLSVALWYWPIDQYKQYPTYKTFQEIVDWLLNEASLERKNKARPLTKEAMRCLKLALRVARDLEAFHWDLEFAQVFADLNHPAGFDACISNPPWKVVGIKDKEIFPSFDPQFLDTRPANKNARIKQLYSAMPSVSEHWLRQSFLTSQMTEHWRKGQLSEIPPEGQVDLCVLFVLRSERITREQGRTGLLVSRSSLFVNKATKGIRQRFFKEWGLTEACSFVNHLKLFEIDSRVEFSLLVGQHGKSSSKPRFIHGLTDPNTLEVVGRNLDTRDVARVVTGPKPAELTEEIISKFFSKQNLSIPGITDPRQLEIAMALHLASGPVVYLDEIDVTIASGIHQTSGPKKGLSQYTEKIPPHELPKWEDVLAGKVGKWVPLYRGRDINLFDPYYGWDKGILHPEQYGNNTSIESTGFDLSRPLIGWRAISQVNNQRTLIVSIIPRGFWSNEKIYLMQPKSDNQSYYLAVIFGSVAADYLTRLVGASTITSSIVCGLPIPNYQSQAIKFAIDIIKNKFFESKKFQNGLTKEERARIDALVWIHYGLKSAVLNRDALSWMLSSQFDCLNRQDPSYKDLVIGHFDSYCRDRSILSGPSEKVFGEKLVNLSEAQKAKSVGSTTIVSRSRKSGS